jgi:hypothetical protein
MFLQKFEKGDMSEHKLRNVNFVLPAKIEM